jgi:hypothetical protein
MWVDSSGQVHRDTNTNSSNPRNSQPNHQPNRTYQNTASGRGSKKWIMVILCIIAFIFIIRQCNTGQARRSQNTVIQSPNTVIQHEFATVNSDALNVRTGPSANNSIMDKIYRTNRVEIIESYDNGWVKIIYSNGRTGYVNGEYLSR